MIELNPTSIRDINDAVAMHVANWRIHHRNTALWCKAGEEMGLMESGGMGVVGELRFATSADAVIPLLPKERLGDFWTADAGALGVRICIRNPDGCILAEAHADTFAMAACVALLRYRGVAVRSLEPPQIGSPKADIGLSGEKRKG